MSARSDPSDQPDPPGQADQADPLDTGDRAADRLQLSLLPEKAVRDWRDFVRLHGDGARATDLASVLRVPVPQVMNIGAAYVGRAPFPGQDVDALHVL